MEFTTILLDVTILSGKFKGTFGELPMIEDEFDDEPGNGLGDNYDEEDSYLIKCAECGHSFYDDCPKCPQCGWYVVDHDDQFPKKSKSINLVRTALVILVLIAFLFPLILQLLRALQ